MNIILVIIRHMTKITKCPIFLDAMNLKKASKSHFLMVLWLNTLCPSLLITLNVEFDFVGEKGKIHRVILFNQS